MLTENQIKEQLSKAYVKAVAAMCGFGCEITQIDMDSIDASITCNGMIARDSIIRSPEIKIQLKATSSIELNNQGLFSFPLPIKNYNDLRGNTLTPRILVILFLPELKDQWMTHSVNDLVIRKCCYWLNLRNMADSQNQASVTVHLPPTNLFSPDTLMDMMIRISKQEAI